VGFACFYFLCEEIDLAVDWIEKAIGQRHSLLFALIAINPVLRTSSRWHALMKQLNLPETFTS
jgi:hypothetical protein